MGEHKEPKISIDQMKKDLQSAKEKLSKDAEGLSVMSPMAEHPFMSLGTAFLSGAVLGAVRDRGEVGDRIIRTMAEVFSEKILSKD